MSNTSKREPEARYTLEKNGLDFIVSSLKNIVKSKRDPSDLKYAVLHIWSGVLLLLKERIRRDHWTLLFSNAANINLKAYESGDFQSISFDQIEKILREVCQITLSSEDKASLEALRKKRNQIEHFSFDINEAAVKLVVARVLDFMVSFIGDHLDPEEFGPDEKELFEELVEHMKTFDAFVAHRMKGLEKELKEHGGRIVYCVSCEQKTFLADSNQLYKCKFCFDKSADYDQIATLFIEHELGLSSYIEYKDGGEWPQYDCPDCGEGAVVPADDKHSEYFCVACGESRKAKNVLFCSRCGGFSENEGLDICDACCENLSRD